MKRYACMPRRRLERGPYAIIAVQPEHIEPIRQWRNAQIDVLRQSAPLTRAQQEHYYASQIWPAMQQPQPANLLVSYFLEDRLIGYGGLVHIAWEHRRAEVSFLLDLSRACDLDRADADFAEFLALMQELAFADLRFHRLSTETYAMRERHIAVLGAAGFRLEGVMRDHVFIQGRPMDSLIHGCLKSDVR
ncbi:MAG: GNAT family N-acetyltransferase [Acidobacteriia bacterium]|nr:GNAT family N-acetyltransferase [Terriglobia bacterium]